MQGFSMLCHLPVVISHLSFLFVLHTYKLTLLHPVVTFFDKLLPCLSDYRAPVGHGNQARQGILQNICRKKPGKLLLPLEKNSYWYCLIAKIVSEICGNIHFSHPGEILEWSVNFRKSKFRIVWEPGIS